MIRLASLASWAARKTCIKGVLRRECRFGLSIQPQSRGATLPDWNMPETVGTGFFRKTGPEKVLEKWGRVDGSHPLVPLVRAYASEFVDTFHPKPWLSFPETSSSCFTSFGFSTTKSSDNHT